MWCVLLVSFLAVAAVSAQDKQLDDDVSDADEDKGLDEEELKVLMAEETEEDEAMMMDEDHSDKTDTASGKAGKAGTDANVSFQVRVRRLENLMSQ